ncbi:RsmE family RNA methyltransferase [Gemmatimonas groenlandica]|uniref:Ribosomal RNA small subunit methyltransferase E n=1 Tax=Gemmatimonas groenlandica TaxID=2732249 RepID=A0A6M4IJF7_9BACT|nr:RsmE family RNA methyltransferase [Gemmatimonas groenlandica]QJR34893.1 RsmE family RNA methyltransferase [Gemmatimonas groenlandica]
MVGLDREGVAAGRPNFVTTEAFAVGATCVLDEHAARHMRVLRLDSGAVVGVRDGQGHVGAGQLVRLTKTQAYVEISDVEIVAPLPEVHLLVPVADRDRMLWLAEKACELGCTSWRPVLWRRSRSVSPRGEGVAFQQKVMARMTSALAQSEGAWLPQPFPEAPLERALLAAPPGDRVVLDPAGAPMVGPAAAALQEPIVLAIGPEGGIEADELEALVAAGFRPVRLGPTVLRFETAAVAALAIARTALGAVAASPSPLRES